ncbi:MAG TPA: hypothetical protein VMV57_08910 [Terracidiphilus sp.]|nr:hypothetical protein [Terracidiphilus sp.]
MPALRLLRKTGFALTALALLTVVCPHCPAQAALLMEQPYGFFGAINPTGHTAIYFERICAETPTQLRHCHPGELGAVISRYQGIAGYDWIAIPLIPYLYSVEDVSSVPTRVDKSTVQRLRDRYHEEHLLSLGEDVPHGNLLRGGWSELVGVSYERRIYAYLFNTTERQDDAFIARMNSKPNHSHFQLLFNNCSDFARNILNQYFPRTFRRSFFPDAVMTTPKQITYKLVRYARKHPSTDLRVFEIPQVPGYRRMSRSNKSIAESLITTAYAIPIAAVNPYLAGGLFVDYLIRGRYHLMPKHPRILEPAELAELAFAPLPSRELTSRELTFEDSAAQNPPTGSTPEQPMPADDFSPSSATSPENPSLTESTDAHER